MPPRITIAARSAPVEVVAGGVDGVTVDGGSIVTTDEGIEITGRSSRLRVGCPAGADVRIATASGKVTTTGPLGDVHITTRSGKVSVGEARRLEVRTMSGRVHVGACEGECRCVVTSGAVTIDRAGSVEVTSTSAKVEVGDVGDAAITVMSGAVVLGTRRNTAVKVRSMSGAVRVQVPADARPRTSLRAKVGKVRCECPTGDDGEIDVKTMSGLIEVTCRK